MAASDGVPKRAWIFQNREINQLLSSDFREREKEERGAVRSPWR